jgi:hypothetical protein
MKRGGKVKRRKMQKFVIGKGKYAGRTQRRNTVGTGAGRCTELSSANRSINST